MCGIFETGFYDVDDGWAYTSHRRRRRRRSSLDDVVNQIEVNVDDLNRAPEIAKEIEKVVGAAATPPPPGWSRTSQLFSALNMERIVTMIVIGLILLVAALNILITLVMMVMEKYRDIAVLMSMGARRQQIRRIFMLQGVLIGVVGSAIGLTAGYTLCYFAEKYRSAQDRRIGLFDELRAFRAALGGRHLDRRGGHPGEFPGHVISGAERHADRAGGSAAVRVNLGRPKIPAMRPRTTRISAASSWLKRTGGFPPMRTDRDA